MDQRAAAWSTPSGVVAPRFDLIEIKTFVGIAASVRGEDRFASSARNGCNDGTKIVAAVVDGSAEMTWCAPVRRSLGWARPGPSRARLADIASIVVSAQSVQG